jgi:hypothetical protein
MMGWDRGLQGLSACGFGTMDGRTLDTLLMCEIDQVSHICLARISPVDEVSTAIGKGESSKILGKLITSTSTGFCGAAADISILFVLFEVRASDRGQ